MTIGKLVSGRYRVDSLIGTGGMANVYKAYDELQKCVVALKVLKEEHREDSEFLRRFEREAKAVLNLDHENIVRSYDVGEDDGLSYIVLEYVEGSTLKTIIKDEGPLAPKVAVNIVNQVLDALSHAHERGIIHRDVKPQNVIITPQGIAKLADFGIARDAAATTRTFAGANVVGTVHYISPEQARGENVTAATDIYSCAIMLYEMLTGNVPFGGDNSVAIALKHLQEDIISPREINPKVSRSLSDVIVRAASKNLKNRYTTARQMKSDLQRAMREPNGKFAMIVDDERKKHNNYGGVARLGFGIVVVIGLFVAMFFIARSLRDDGGTEQIEYIVPTLTGKSFESAKELAELRGFVILESDRMFSEEYAEGTVLEQSPVAGTKAGSGDVIEVIISEGSDYVVVPNFIGATIHEAAINAADNELVIGEPIYDPSSEKPAGTIIKQEPAEGTSTVPGDEIAVWISGTPDNSIEMPDVTGQNIDVAVNMLKEDGFTSIVIHPYIPENVAVTDTIVKQTPSAGVNAVTDDRVDVWVSRPTAGEFSADMAFNIDVEGEKASVMITAVIGENTELVIYETELGNGMGQAVSFTGYMHLIGKCECRVYVDGELIKSTTALFARK